MAVQTVVRVARHSTSRAHTFEQRRYMIRQTASIVVASSGAIQNSIIELTGDRWLTSRSTVVLCRDQGFGVSKSQMLISLRWGDLSQNEGENLQAARLPARMPSAPRCSSAPSRREPATPWSSCGCPVAKRSTAMLFTRRSESPMLSSF